MSRGNWQNGGRSRTLRASSHCPTPLHLAPQSVRVCIPPHCHPRTLAPLLNESAYSASFFNQTRLPLGMLALILKHRRGILNRGGTVPIPYPYGAQKQFSSWPRRAELLRRRHCRANRRRPPRSNRNGHDRLIERLFSRHARVCARRVVAEHRFRRWLLLL